MNVAERLKALRNSLHPVPTVRALAAIMGAPDVPNTYGYYESKSFTKDRLPLDKARVIAAAFARHGGRPEDVLELAGLTADEIAREPVTAADPVVSTQFIQMAVALPSADALTTMMHGLLVGVGLRDAADAHAERLARRLPKALAQISGRLTSDPIGAATSRDEPAPPPSTRHLD